MNNSTAFHESGHVMMIILLGIPWKFATAKPTYIFGDRCEGFVWFERPENVDDHIRVLLAGYGAEKIFNIPICQGSKMEFEESIQLAKNRDDYPKLWAEALLHQTTEMLKDYKKEMSLLADLLQSSETITPDSIEPYQIKKREL